MRRAALVGGVLVAAVLWLHASACTCGDSGDEAGDPREALTEAGLTPESWGPTPAEVHGAASCEQGKVAGLEVLVCTFDSDEAAEAAREQTLERVGKGALTAVARRQGARIVAVADRDGVDPRGKQISAVVKALGVAGSPPAE